MYRPLPALSPVSHRWRSAADRECPADRQLIETDRPAAALFSVDHLADLVTNFSAIPFSAQIWFNTKPPGRGVILDKVSPGNTTFSPLPVPKTELQFVQSISGFPTSGVNVLDRLVGPKGTLASEDDGKWIIPPGGNFIVFLILQGLN